MDYYTTIAFLTISINIILITIVALNKNLSKKTRDGFIAAFSFILIGAVIELIGTIDEISASFTIFTKLVKFSIVPLMPLICTCTIFEQDRESLVVKFLKIYFVLYEIYMYIEYFTYSFNMFYNITAKIYFVSFIFSSIYMFFKAFQFSNCYQNTNKIELVLIIIFISFGITAESIKEDVKISWLTIAVASAFIYIYYNELIQCVDGLTTLLNQKSFSNYIENIDVEVALIIFDVNDFKIVNDTYGHNFGDKILCTISKLLKDTYQDYGKCYRIGGDEFAVILTKELDMVDRLNKKFISSVSKQKILQHELPHISYGTVQYNPKNKLKYSATDALNDADAEMYKYKEQFKSNK